MEMCELVVQGSENNPVRCRVCDCAGQSAFYPQHELFLMSRCIFLLCHPLNKTDSMVPFQGWLEEVKARSNPRDTANSSAGNWHRDTLSMIVLTKSDEANRANDVTRKVDLLSRKIGISCYNDMVAGVYAVTSKNKSDGDGISYLEEGIARLVLESPWAHERLGPKIRSVRQCACDWYRPYEKLSAAVVSRSDVARNVDVSFLDKVKQLFGMNILPRSSPQSISNDDRVEEWLQCIDSPHSDVPVVPWSVFVKYALAHPMCSDNKITEDDVRIAVRILHRMGIVVLLPFENWSSEASESVVLSGHWLSTVILPCFLQFIVDIAPNGYVDLDELNHVMRSFIPESVVSTLPEMLMNSHLMFHESVSTVSIVTPLSFPKTRPTEVVWPPGDATAEGLQSYSFQLSYVPRRFLTLFFRELYRCGTVHKPWQGDHGVSGADLIAGGCLFRVVESEHPTLVLLDWGRRRVTAEHVAGDHCAAITVLAIVDRLIKSSFPGVSISVVCPNPKCPHPIHLEGILNKWELKQTTFHDNRVGSPGCGQSFEISKVLPEPSALDRLPIFPGDLQEDNVGPLMKQLLRLRDSKSRPKPQQGDGRHDIRPCVFISFSGEERAAARLLKQRLDAQSQNEFKIFLDENRDPNTGLEVGMDINATLHQHLWTCTVGVCLLSVSYIQKSAPQMELDVLWRRRCRGEHGVLVPLFHHTLPPEMCKRSTVSGVETLANELRGVSRICGEVWGKDESAERFVDRIVGGIVTHVKNQLRLYHRRPNDSGGAHDNDVPDPC